MIIMKSIVTILIGLSLACILFAQKIDTVKLREVVNKEDGENTNIFKIVWSDNKFGYFIDSRDNHKYKVVKIHDQIWFAENLAFKPQDGNYQAYNNDQKYVEKFGYLYNIEAAVKVCPDGWHLPNNEEWDKLRQFAGYKASEEDGLSDCNGNYANALKENGGIGFNILFYANEVEFWSSTFESGSYGAHIYSVCAHCDCIAHYGADKNRQVAVRCIKNY
jgi:uncharacterized protein (TIGR02145 family)